MAPIADAQSGRLTLVYACDDAVGALQDLAAASGSRCSPAPPPSQKITLRKVNAPTARAMLQPASWPTDLRWVLDTFLMSQEGVQEDMTRRASSCCRTTRSRFATVGNNGWREFMWPTILDMTNTKP